MKIKYIVIFLQNVHTNRYDVAEKSEGQYFSSYDRFSAAVRSNFGPKNLDFGVFWDISQYSDELAACRGDARAHKNLKNPETPKMAKNIPEQP